MLGQKCASHGPSTACEPADLAASFAPPPEAVAGRPAGSMTLIFTSSGERLWRRVEYWPVDDQNGTLIGLLGLVREADAPRSAADSQANEIRVQLMRLRERLHRSFGFESLIGRRAGSSPASRTGSIGVTSTVPVLIVGEPGTGKRTVARTIHHLGMNRNQPLVPIDCEALPFDKLEGELFAAGRKADAGPSGLTCFKLKPSHGCRSQRHEPAAAAHPSLASRPANSACRMPRRPRTPDRHDLRRS